MLLKVDQLYLRKRATSHPTTEGLKGIAAFHDVPQRLKGGGCAPEYAERAALTSPYKRNITGVVAQAFFLLVRPIVLLINDDQA